MTKKIDFKTWVIVILGIALIITFFFGQKNRVDTHADEITTLHKTNEVLLKSNDSLKTLNLKLDSDISAINTKLKVNDKNLSETQLELDNLKKRKHETPVYVNHLSANGISNAFSNYLNTKSSNNH